jgi:hypothetical protein
MPPTCGAKSHGCFRNLKQNCARAARPHLVVVDLPSRNIGRRGSMSETTTLYYWGESFVATISIRREPTREMDESRRPSRSPHDLSVNGTYSKHRDGTVTYEDRSITVTCYLCNTDPKTARDAASEAVPLLRAQVCSVIVSMRRRGASRGRPVRWFASVPRVERECPKARSG